MKNRVDRAEIFETVKCGGSECGHKWTEWCRGCNGVYCSAHSDMTAHTCKRTDMVRGNAGAGLTGPEAKPKRKRKKPSRSPLAPSGTTQLTLGVDLSGNGKSHG